jgi:hypothetical protein
VQACHACLEATRAFLSSDHQHPFLVVCGARDEQRLGRCRDRLRQAGIHFRAFYEPDLGDQLTAIATEPLRGQQRQLLQEYRLLSVSG